MDVSPDTVAWLQTLVTAVIGALVGGAVSTVTASRLERRRWHRDDVVYWRTKRRAYATSLVSLIEARDGLLRGLRVDDERRAAAAHAMHELSERAAPVNFETRMIAATEVEAAIAKAAVALDVDYDDPAQVTAERVEHYRDAS